MMANEKRLIDYEQAKRATYEEIFWTESEQAVVRNFLAKLPKVDAVEVVHGRWIDNIDENGFLCNAWRKCSACGGLNYSKKPPYCPNCGSKMDGGNADGICKED